MGYSDLPQWGDPQKARCTIALMASASCLFQLFTQAGEFCSVEGAALAAWPTHGQFLFDKDEKGAYVEFDKSKRINSRSSTSIGRKPQTSPYNDRSTYQQHFPMRPIGHSCLHCYTEIKFSILFWNHYLSTDKREWASEGWPWKYNLPLPWERPGMILRQTSFAFWLGLSIV